MKYLVASLFILTLILSCDDTSVESSNVVDNNEALLEALAEAEPGDHIIMENGEWEDIQIKITASGTESKPITLRAETAGEVLIQGASNLELGGDYIHVEGLTFVNGHSPSRAVIHFAANDTVANHCIVSHCVIKDYNKMQRNFQDLWVLFEGRHNQMDHCYLAGKSNRGPTIRVDLEGNENIKNYHKIINNHFGPRPPKGGPSAETIQIGNSYTSMCPSYTLVGNNLFEECNGEVEIISSKTNFNEFRNNVFYKSEGSLVTRHGNYCIVDGNYFIGDESNSNIGGVRLIGTGHTVTNNYFYNLKGKDFRSPLAVMNGIPKSPLNRYIQVTDVIVAYNTYVNCVAPLQFGVGTNISQKDVLPASEIRSARPIRTLVANNLLYNNTGDAMPVVAHDELDGITFKNNFINNQGLAFQELEGLKSSQFEIEKIADYISIPSSGLPNDEVYLGFGFDEFDKDIFGASRGGKNTVGAVIGKPASAPAILDKSRYGPEWYEASPIEATTNTHTVSNGSALIAALSEANDGDLIVVEDGAYEINAPLPIDKTITIEGKGSDAKVQLKYTGAAETALFQMNPKGKLTLKNIDLVGGQSQYAFASLKENMSSHYDLRVEDCKVENFDYILKAYKYSFAQNISLRNSTFINCSNGLELAEETDDRGEYNAENINIDQCTFDRISDNVIDYYRGGYDESTVGGNLVVTRSTFSNCGTKEQSGVLLNTYGIINVNLADNTFKNNRTQLVARLWGAKNNTHSNNVVENSGKIIVEENLKLRTFY